MAIVYNEQNKTFYLESKDVTYAFCISEYGFLNHLYYGKRIPQEDLRFGVALFDRGHGCALPGAKRREHSLNSYANEFPSYGHSDFRESMVAFCDESGVRVVNFVYDGHEIIKNKPELSGLPSVRGGETLVIRLKEKRINATALLYYTVYEDLPVILRHVEFKNDGNKSFTIDRAYSFCLDMPDNNWEAITLPGSHLRERFIERTKLSHGIFSVDSKRGESSAQMNPFMALVRKNTDEEQGEAYGFNLVYSGDFVFKAQSEENDELRITGGINDFDFSWTLRPNERFVAPEIVMVYSDSGIGNMSRTFHDLYRNYLINPRFVFNPHPIVINNWEATYCDFNAEKLCGIIDSVKGTGIDTFVLDDGWFGKRNDDKTSLGDWYVNKEKLPGGLKPVIDYAHKNGMKFGLWFEPEMISPDSDLFRKHPDWAIHIDGLTPCVGREQLVLDLTREEVCKYIIDALSDILKNNEIDYVKWDMNRCLTENYSAWLGKNAKETKHRYILGLYKICQTLTETFPNVFFEGCASGGCRFDPAMLYYFPQLWTSDNTDAYWRSVIQYGTSLCYPLSAQSCHVSACPNHQCGRVTPFETRAAIARLGSTGYELDTTKLDEKELNDIKRQVAKYKSIEDLILKGDLYRLNSPSDGNIFAEMLVSKDKERAFITVMRTLCVPNGVAIRIYPKGLDEKTIYRIKESGLERSGATLMRIGIVVDLPNADFSAATFTIEKV